MLMREIDEGKSPSLAPTKNSLAEENIAPFKAPKVEQATNKGIIQDHQFKSLSPNVCQNGNVQQSYNQQLCNYLFVYKSIYVSYII